MGSWELLFQQQTSRDVWKFSNIEISNCCVGHTESYTCTWYIPNSWFIQTKKHHSHKLTPPPMWQQPLLRSVLTDFHFFLCSIPPKTTLTSIIPFYSNSAIRWMGMMIHVYILFKTDLWNNVVCLNRVLFVLLWFYVTW